MDTTGIMSRTFVEFLDRHFRQADVPDFALLLHVAQNADLLVERNFRVYAVQLVQVNAVQAQAAQAHLHALPQILRAPYGRPHVRALPRQSAFGGDHQIEG